MKRMIYCSQSVRDVSPDELVELLTVSRRNNESVGVSGMLLYCSQSFLQMLEGEPAAVQVTYDRIAADDRHNNVRVLLDADVPSRMFPDWSMGFEHVDEDELALDLPAYTPAVEYPLINPDLVHNAGVAQTLLRLYARNRVH